MPTYSHPREQKQILQIVKDFPFVTLISKDDNGHPYVSHIPVFSKVEDHQIVAVTGHFSLRNPHVRYLKADSSVTIIFHGPHTYITPKWYKSGRDVPTWNYCVVSITGQLCFNESFDEICANLKELTASFEKGPEAWGFQLPDDLIDPASLTGAIVAFTVVPIKIEAKFKLSQNRQRMDQAGIIEGLQTRTDDLSREIQKLMKSNLA